MRQYETRLTVPFQNYAISKLCSQSIKPVVIQSMTITAIIVNMACSHSQIIYMRNSVITVPPPMKFGSYFDHRRPSLCEHEI